MSQNESADRQDTPSVGHPLEPLTADEIKLAVHILRQQQQLPDTARFSYIALKDPAKSTVWNHIDGKPFAREAFCVILDRATAQTYEAVVCLVNQEVKSYVHRPGVQSSITLDEFAECENAIKADVKVQAALKLRGIEDTSLIMCDPWSAGNYGYPNEEGRRLVRAMCWLKTGPEDNGYARPIEGVVPVVDLTEMRVISVDDYGVVPLPSENGNYAASYMKHLRTDLKPIEITQPDGVSFKVDGHHIQWQKWSLRLGFNPREGLVLYTVAYADDGTVRPVLYRASLAEMVVPYADPSGNHYRKNAFDVGEYGVGMMANSLTLGCDCLGEIYYFDAVVHNSLGEPMVIPNAVCMHEEDFGILWKHMDWRTEATEVRRSRRLVISFIATAGNYEYGFFWYFYQDGSIQYEVKLTGICNTAALPEGETPRYGRLVAPQLNAQIHQHFFNVRLDTAIDGAENSVLEVNTYPEPMGERNPHGNAHYAEETVLKTESEAQRDLNGETQRYWRFINSNKMNRLGDPVGYRLLGVETTKPFAHPEASISKRAGFMNYHLWVTPYHPAERYPADDYPNQNPGGDGLPSWASANRNIENTDIVVWYTFGHHHIPRLEDWPVMPVSCCGFWLKPCGFFGRNPALDVPLSSRADETCCHTE